VEADQRFAQLSAQAGRRAAFLEFLAPDSVVFREGPVDALTLYSSSSFAEAASEIDWKAHYVDVSNAGDVGLSAGPLTIFNESGSDSYGHLISMWRSSGAGWELMADIVVGIPGFLSLDVEPSYADTLPVIAETANPASVSVAENTLQSLVDADELFGRSINFRGGQRALLRYGLENTRVYLPGMGPAVGAEAASSVYGAFLDNQLATTNPVNLSNLGAYLSSSQEMGYTYGTMETDSSAAEAGFKTSYMRLWRFNQEGEWRIAVEVLSPF
jgi:ketosteroid isomerase-like protein